MLFVTLKSPNFGFADGVAFRVADDAACGAPHILLAFTRGGRRNYMVLDRVEQVFPCAADAINLVCSLVLCGPLVELSQGAAETVLGRRFRCYAV